jgi:hypothetical protein
MPDFDTASPKLLVIFRSCSTVASYHGQTRFLDVPKSELLLGCFRSLVASIVHARAKTEWPITLALVDDHSDETVVKELQEIARESGITFSFHALTETTGNGASLAACYAYADSANADLIYFVEDDYLHAESALIEMIEAYQYMRVRMEQDVVVHPYDSPDRYADPYPSFIFASRERYWRTVRHTTGTFVVSKDVFKKYRKNYEDFSTDSGKGIIEDGTINKIYEEVPCISPMPSLAVHMETPAHLPPFVPWKMWWERAVGKKGE